MTKKSDIHLNAPAGGGGPGAFRSAAPLGTNLDLDRWFCPCPLGVDLSLPFSDIIGIDFYSYYFLGAAICSTPNSDSEQVLKQTHSIAAITGSVGLNGVNKAQDVRTVQVLLNQHKPSAAHPISEDGLGGPKTIAAIIEFQKRVVKLHNPDGRVDPQGITWQALTGGTVTATTTSAASDDNFSFPLAYCPSISWNTGYRYFGAPRRKGRKHAGCDLLGPPGTPIYAIADGVLVRGPYNFTSPKNGLRITDAVEIRHGDLLIRYGEIRPHSYVGGKNPRKGQVIAKIGDLKMLHFEVYTNGASTASLSGGGQYKRRSDVTNPAPYLDKWVKNLPGK